MSDEKKKPKDGKTSAVHNNYNITGNVGAVGDGAKNEGIVASTVHTSHSASSPVEYANAPVMPRPTDSGTSDGGVFISYSHADETIVAPVIMRLYQLGCRVWWDKANLGTGIDWMDEIDSALLKSSCMLLFVTNRALQSDFVKREYRYFLNNLRNGKKLYLLLCEAGAQIPPSLQGIQYTAYAQYETAVQTIKHACC